MPKSDRPDQRLLTIGAFLSAALVATGIGVATAAWIERRTDGDVRAALQRAGQGWAEVNVDGLRVYVSGVAPGEVSRFRALSAVGAMVETSRIRDQIEVAAPDALEAPGFVLEALRNDDGVSLIGLIPTDGGRETMLRGLAALGGVQDIADMTETADFSVPEGWVSAVEFGLAALVELPRAKVSIAPGRVEVNAIADSFEQRDTIDSALRARQPEGVELATAISAPRPVLSPFLFMAERSDAGLNITACSASTEADARRIVSYASRSGLVATTTCEIGLGAPSPRWVDWAISSMRLLNDLGDARVTIRDADIVLIAGAEIDPARFNRLTRAFETSLGGVFAFEATIAEREQEGNGGAESGRAVFLITRNEDGQVRMRGLVPDERSGRVAETFAAALFGRERVYSAARVEDELPEGWPRRVMAAIEGLSHLHSGAVTVSEDEIVIRGRSADPEAERAIVALLSERLGEGDGLRLEVSYDPALDPALAGPSPEACLAEVKRIGTEQKITFAPGASSVGTEARAILREIADVLRECPELPLEIAGHTDSQGRASMNLALSQARADAVLDALMGMRVLTGKMIARGYGQTEPIADNSTEEGREANRRIEFRLRTDLAQGSGTDESEGVAGADASEDASEDEGGAEAEEGDDEQG